ncbi:hypothetical protein H6F93_15150 [Leptolyngbya sp. FACHB-671]|uniref:DUF6973 domain-containing protein n=1 Tax=Leptolyngbya sp. FACHB-671 TaxID=2692812 RepID=UPI001686D38E|nr:hypothetical protein [Leptolyngbya sp. FACHB-671]MBD2068844.1 hypothetical protein [Leptolyngbya sp. FACHB-671]
MSPIRMPFLGEVSITETEARMLDELGQRQGLLALQKVQGIKDQASGEADNQFASPGDIPDHVPLESQDKWLGTDGHRDAFRHAYANSLLTKEFGEEWTSQFATAHEAIPDNPPNREAMDLYNNEVGRRIAVENPDASEAELAQLIRRAVDNGELVVLDQNGEPAWSNEVPEWQHGLDNSPPEEGGQPVPDGDALADGY